MHILLYSNTVKFYSVEGEYQLVTWSRDNTLRLCRYESSAKSKVYISFMCIS